MKIQIDTEKKIIKLNAFVELKSFISFLEKILPDGEWKEYTLETTEVINNFNTPIIVERVVPHFNPLDNILSWHKTYCGGSLVVTGGSANLHIDASEKGSVVNYLVE